MDKVMDKVIDVKCEIVWDYVEELSEILSSGKQDVYRSKYKQIRTILNNLSEQHNQIVSLMLGQGRFVKLIKGIKSNSLRYRKLVECSGVCCVCGWGLQDGVKLELDHIVPLSKGGSDTEDNIQVLCSKCNIGKSNRDCIDHRKNRGGLVL